MPYPYYPNYSNLFNPNQFYSNVPQTPSNVPTMSGNSITWVQGEADAKARPVNAGTSSLFMDSENSVFYIKTVDNSGIPQPLRIFEYKERGADPTTTPIDKEKAVTRSEFDALADKVERLINAGGEG